MTSLRMTERDLEIASSGLPSTLSPSGLMDLCLPHWPKRCLTPSFLAKGNAMLLCTLHRLRKLGDGMQVLPLKTKAKKRVSHLSFFLAHCHTVHPPEYQLYTFATSLLAAKDASKACSHPEMSAELNWMSRKQNFFCLVACSLFPFLQVLHCPLPEGLVQKPGCRGHPPGQLGLKGALRMRAAVRSTCQRDETRRGWLQFFQGKHGRLLPQPHLVFWRLNHTCFWGN